MSIYLIQDVPIGENLRRFRKKEKYTQEQVAQALRDSGYDTMCREKISRMERGQYSIQISILIELKKLYKLNHYDEFFEPLPPESESCEDTNS